MDKLKRSFFEMMLSQILLAASRPLIASIAENLSMPSPLSDEFPEVVRTTAWLRCDYVGTMAAHLVPVDLGSRRPVLRLVPLQNCAISDDV